MSDSVIKMITGLGNPGKQYSQTRHNMGFLVIDDLARQHSLLINKTRFDADYIKARIFGRDIFLVKPQSYMNRSGFPVQRLAAYYKIDVESILVIHDDLDLAFGTMKIVQNRGHGGHNGVRSIIDAFGSRAFCRMRLGVGRPNTGNSVTGHVLGGFSKNEQGDLEKAVEDGVQACKTILTKGVTHAMNQWNQSR
ncbi:MAG: aminoacyl-tRNA hydrolase [Desulfobacteraceae bacterium]|nr:MAG: aminoacyl-tRNA hydrolase [Desulfobacteraceae bacterium]